MPGSGDTPYVDAGNPDNDPSLPGYDPSKPSSGTNQEPTNKADVNVQQAEPTTQPASALDTFSTYFLGVSVVALVAAVIYVLVSDGE